MKIQIKVEDITVQMFVVVLGQKVVPIENGSSKILKLPKNTYYLAWTMVGSPNQGLTIHVIDFDTGKDILTVKNAKIPLGKPSQYTLVDSFDIK